MNDKPLTPAGTSNIEQDSWLGFYVTSAPGFDWGAHGDVPGPGAGAAAQQPLELRLSRVVGDAVHEEIDITNWTQRRVAFSLDLELDSDFADAAETRGTRKQHGTLSTAWSEAGPSAWELRLDYRAEHHFDHRGESGMAELWRGMVLRVLSPASVPAWRDGRLRFELDLGAGDVWHARLDFIPHLEGTFVAAPALGHAAEGSKAGRRFFRRAASFATLESETLAPVVVGALERARHDLASLRLYDHDHGEHAWVASAGLPVYVALFGRDSLTTGWQAALLGPELMRGALLELPRWQGKAHDDWRDEQPGKMLHQAERGPLATLNFSPIARYYGSVSTSALYPIVLCDYWRWTGDTDLIRPLVAPALAGLRWMDEYADIDHDGFCEYQTRSEMGLHHQAWKDSDDAMVHGDGSQAETPLGTCEEQGYTYLAKLRLAELLDICEEVDEARRLRREADDLKRRFNQTFWMEEEGFCAMARQTDGRLVRALGSNAGHCLTTGIIDGERARSIAERLFAPDLFSGWGIRTLSTKNAAYNPYSYHRGSVWPYENASIALGLLRCGAYGELEHLCRAMFDVASLYDHHRLPELFAGHSRDEQHPFPALYPNTNWPQAWSASAVFLLVQTLLGLYPYARLNLLVVDPRLPAWLPELVIRDLRVAGSVVSLQFVRGPDGSTDFQVLDQRGELKIVRHAISSTVDSDPARHLLKLAVNGGPR